MQTPKREIHPPPVNCMCFKATVQSMGAQSDHQWTYRPKAFFGGATGPQISMPVRIIRNHLVIFFCRLYLACRCQTRNMKSRVCHVEDCALQMMVHESCIQLLVYLLQNLDHSEINVAESAWVHAEVCVNWCEIHSLHLGLLNQFGRGRLPALDSIDAREQKGQY